MKVFLLVVLSFSLILGTASAKPPEIKLVHGADYEGAIFYSEAIGHAGVPFESKKWWTPSKALVKEAEAALPAAIAKKMRAPRHRGPNFPQAYTSKTGTNLHFTDEPRDLLPNSLYADDFLYDIHNDISQYKRQYIGEIVNGRKVLLMSFIWDPEGSATKDPALAQWRANWIDVLGGGSSFWRVYYHPATKTFSDWECNG